MWDSINAGVSIGGQEGQTYGVILIISSANGRTSATNTLSRRNKSWTEPGVVLKLQEGESGIDWTLYKYKS